MKNILITGANGFIGSNLCRYFLKKDYNVYGLVRKMSDLCFLDDLNVKLVYGDLTEVEKIEFPKDLDFVVHCAAVVSDLADDKSCERNIYNATIYLVNYLINNSIQLRKFIYISTSLVLGYGKLNISEKNPGRPAFRIPYVKYKLKTEKFLLGMHRECGLPLVILRPADVYGPYDRTSCIHMLKGIENGVPPIVGHGKWIFPLCYVENLCQATCLACETKNIEGQSYTITNNSDITWKDFFSVFLKRLNKKQIIYVPVWVAYLVPFFMKIIHFIVPTFKPSLTFYRIRRITTHTSYDVSKTIKELNYTPDKNVEKQLNLIVDWYLKEKTLGHTK